MKKLMMKLALSTVMTVAAASAANAGCLGELLVKGNARQVSNCQFNIEFTQPPIVNQTCPLIYEDIKTKISGDCSIKEGDVVEGIIIRNEDNSFRLDR